MVEVETGPFARDYFRRGGSSTVHWDLDENLCGHFSNLLCYQICSFIKLATQINHCSNSELANIYLRTEQMYSTCHFKKNKSANTRICESIC